MSKKIIAACMAMAALAAFAAATSSAAELTHPTGTRLAVGTKWTATNIGIIKVISSGLTLECSKAVLTGALTKNNGVEVEGTVETASFKGTESEERCKSNLGAVKFTTNVGNGVPWCVKFDNGAEMKMTIRGNSCANAARSLTFVLDVAGLECKYERTVATGPIVGTYTTDTSPENSDAVGHILPAGSAFVGEPGNPFLCPTSLSLELSLTFETDTVTPEPLYIS